MDAPRQHRIPLETGADSSGNGIRTPWPGIANGDLGGCRRSIPIRAATVSERFCVAAVTERVSIFWYRNTEADLSAPLAYGRGSDSRSRVPAAVSNTRSLTVAALILKLSLDFPAWLLQPFGPHGDCRLTQNPNDTVLRDFFLNAARLGRPVTNIHVMGDRGLDDYLDLLEEANRKYGVTDLRFSADHCGYVTDAQAQRAKKLGLTTTCSPDVFDNAGKGTLGAYTAIYDKQRAADSVAPFRRLIQAGIKPSAHCEGHQDWSFSCLQFIITRKDRTTGEVWGAQQRIDRREALYPLTRWAAWHVWKEQSIGSIEPGKWADLVVIDGDYLTVPEDEISQLNPLLTIVNGKISYSDPKFAAGVGLPTVGFQAPPNWWGRNAARLQEPM